MDDKNRTAIAHIITALRDDLDYAKSELSRLDFEDEAAKKDGDTHGPNAAGGIQNPPQPQGRHFGMAMLPIHYTLGRGVPEALGDDTEGVAFRTFREVATATNRQGVGELEVNVRGVGMLATSFWDKEKRLVCLHLELAHTQQCRDTQDWEECEQEIYQDRSLN